MNKKLKNIDFKAIQGKILSYMQNIGQKVAYVVLLLFFAYQRKETPNWAKHIIIGAIGYFITPFDALPDLTPILGYTDDIGVMSFGLVTVAAYVNDEVRIKARRKLKNFFGELDFDSLHEVDEKI